MRRIRCIAAAVALLVLVAAAPADAAPRWTRAATLYKGCCGVLPQIGFNARGDAVLTLDTYDGLFTRLRPAGGPLGRMRPLRGPWDSAPTPVVDPDRGAGLIGEYFDSAPEFEQDLRDECCYRLIAGTLSPRGRAGRTRKLSPRGGRISGASVETDGRGNAGAVWSLDDGYQYSLRRRGGLFSPPRPVTLPDGFDFGVLTVPPTGSMLATWRTRDAREVWYASARPGRAFGAQTQVASASEPGESVYPWRLARGPRGDIWIVYQVSARESGSPRMVAVRRRADGTFGPHLTIAAGTWSGDLATAVDDRGSLHAVWQDNRYRVFARSFSRRGSAGPLQKLSGATNYSVFRAAVAAGSGGRAVVVWRDGSRILGAHRVGGGPFRSFRRLDRRADELGYLRVEMDSRGTAIASWVQRYREDDAVRYAVLNP